MAGIIAAIRDNSKGIVGGASNVQLVITRALRDDKKGSLGTMLDAMKACLEHQAKSE